MKTTLTKACLASAIVTQANFTDADAKQATEELITITKNSIFKRETFYIPTMGKIVTLVKAARPGINPKTRDKHLIAPRHSIRFSRAEGVQSNKMNVSRLVDSIMFYGYSRITASTLAKIYYDFLRSIQEGLVRIEIRGLGTFDTTIIHEHTARNPKTGESVVVPTKAKPTFKVSPSLRKAMDTEYLV